MRRTPLDAKLRLVSLRIAVDRLMVGMIAALVPITLVFAWLKLAPAPLLPGNLEPLIFVFAVALLPIIGFVVEVLWYHKYHWPEVALATARRIEARYPDLNARLLTALQENARHRPGQVVGYLPATVIREALDHNARHDWRQVISTRRLGLAWLGEVLVLVLSLALMASIPWKPAKPDVAKSLVAIDGLATAADIEVDPGNTEVERGSPLLVVARFRTNVPGRAQLVVVGSAATVPPAPMARSLEDPTFAGRIEAVDRELTYRVAFDGGTSPSYRVRVFTFPEVKQVDAHLAYPGYTGLESKTLADIRHVTAVEGTTLSLTFLLNKEVATARLVDEQGEAIPLELVAGSVTTTPEGEAVATYRAGWVLAESHKYQVDLVDRAGRRPKAPTELAVNVTPNRPATVVMSRPGKDMRVSPVEELDVQARTEDDFGVVRHGINYTTPGGEPVDLVLDPNSPAARKRVASHLIAFEELKAQPDQLVSYFFWAEDVGPDAQPRRTSGDLFFAEVRHFEEIFRQGEAPPGGSQEQQQQQNGNAQQAEKLAELQKQVIAATWKLIRREDDAEPSNAFAADATAIREGQAAAIEQTQPMAQALRDATSKANLAAAVGAMKQAEALLTDAVNGLEIPKLKPALAAEQAAYQALLKLRAREFEVSRQRQRQQQGGGGGSAAQQQLDELELSNDENRYEEQKSAKSQQDANKADADRRETRQVLNRLAELARRQADLNERLKELQAALDAAKTPDAKAEAERQLKRLRDQEQQILRDTDEVRERMEREANRDRMAEARPEIDKGREQVRQASEALEKGQVSQALNEGTRAERQLKDLREDLRKKSSERFSDEVGEMRDQARHLTDEQTRLTEQLNRWDDQAKRSLRDPDARKDVGANLTQQKQELNKLLDQMRDTVTEAEETEPLLAKELFDAVQKATRKEIPKDLDEAGQLTQAGLPDEAARSSRQAGAGLDDLREGVERAARSILGDESAALKRAQNELEDLADQASRGLARADGPNNRRSATPGDPGQSGDPTERPPGANPPGTDLAKSATGPLETAREGAANRIGQSTDRPDPRGRQPGAATPAAGDRQPAQQQQSGLAQGERADEGLTPGSSRQPAQRQSGQGEVRQPGQTQPGQGQQPGESQQPGEGQQPDGSQGPQPDAPSGRQPARGEGRQPGQGAQPGPGGRGEQPGQAGPQPGPGQSGQQPGQQEQAGDQPGQGQGQQPGSRQPGQRGGGGAAGGNRGDLTRQMEGFDPNASANPAGNPNGGGGGGGTRGGEIDRPEGPNPITGDGFRQWSDRLRDVEDLLNSPDLRAEAARIRDRARGAREEARRHAAPIDPAQLKQLVADPLVELRDRVAEEVRRRESPDALVPIDRDPVPPRFAEGVRRYYERLGSGR